MPTPEETKAQELMSRIVSGDPQAYAELYNEYADLIFSVAMYLTKDKHLAEDAVQFVFLKVWERKIDVADMENPVGWMRNTAKFHLFNTFKKQMAERQLYQDLPMQTEIQDPADLMMSKQRRDIITNAINSLPTRQQEVYRMSREQGLTYAEIANQLQLAHETVKEHMARALKNIKQLLDKQKDMLFCLVAIFCKTFFL